MCGVSDYYFDSVGGGVQVLCGVSDYFGDQLRDFLGSAPSRLTRHMLQSANYSPILGLASNIFLTSCPRYRVCSGNMHVQSRHRWVKCGSPQYMRGWAWLLQIFPPWTNLFPKTSNDSTFFEALAEQTKLAGIKTQKLLFCIQNLKKEKLSDKIALLRTNYDANYLEILHAERELGKIHNNELRDKLQDLKFFEILQAEKANAHFLDICSKKGLLHRKIFYCHLLNLEIILLICILHCLGLTRMCKVRLKIFLDRKQANTPWSVVVF